MTNHKAFFDFAAEVGLTKHIGGVEATNSLIEFCRIGKDTYVLDVGCGVGVTPAFLAKTVGCRVTGIDINEGMVRRSRERAKKEGLVDKVEFLVADAQYLPFEDNTFDAVITESVTAFPEDKQKAVSEYVRVVKKGGFVGLNESTWLKEPPPPEMVQWASQDLGVNVKPLSSEEWVELLSHAGLTELVTKIFEIDMKSEAKGITRRYGSGGMFKIFARMLSLYFRNREYREFVMEVKRKGIAPKNLNEYFGYGLYVGKK